MSVLIIGISCVVAALVVVSKRTTWIEKALTIPALFGVIIIVSNWPAVTKFFH